MTDNEKLIEEAAKAIQNLIWTKPFGHMITNEEAARAALAVFEKAHTPTAIWSEKEVPPLIRELRMSQGDGSDWTEDLFARAADALEAAEKAHTPTNANDDERAIAVCIEIASTVYGDYDDAQGALSDIHMMLAPIAAASCVSDG